MKIGGFTFVRNAVLYDYPVIESITSILPLCDEFVVAVGNSDDNTKDLIHSIPSKKIRIVDTVWDDSLRKGGKVLAQETNKAYSALSSDCTWAFYLQADEVVHEKYLPLISQALHEHANNPFIEGLLFKYLHFYGSYDYIGESFRWYRREIRIVRKLPGIFSYRDAQGFRIRDNKKLRVKLLDAFVYHYGWVKKPDSIQEKLVNFSKYWHDDQWVEQKIVQAAPFDYSRIDALSPFRGTHPETMRQRIAQKNWTFIHDISKKYFSTKEKFLRLVLRLTGVRIGEYRNYKIVS